MLGHVTTSISPALAEQAQALAYFDFEAGAPAATRAALGMTLARFGGGTVMALRNAPPLWSKALGFGFEEPVTASLIERICDVFRAQGLHQGVIQLPPSVTPGDWGEIRAKHNISPGTGLVKLVASTELVIELADLTGSLDAGLRVGRVAAADADEWASVMASVFGYDSDPMQAMCASSVGRSGWVPCAVWDGDRIVATATTHFHQRAAHLFGGATLPEARGRGAQTALLVLRARAALAAGCRWLVAETGAEPPGGHNSSLHNLLRLGFQIQYVQPNWIWRPIA
jgi:ribosomal protein S18 acetylase RimI-like enzyme